MYARTTHLSHLFDLECDKKKKWEETLIIHK